jgi:hypothetical protein
MDLLYKKLNRKLDVLTQNVRIDDKPKEMEWHMLYKEDKIVKIFNKMQYVMPILKHSLFTILVMLTVC